MAYYKTRNAGARNNGGTVKHHGTVAEQQNTNQNTIETPQNNNGTPA